MAPKRHREPTPTPEPSSSSTSGTPEPSQSTKRGRFENRYGVKERTNEEVLDAQMKKWTSEVYKHFKMPPEIELSKGDVRYRFYCVHTPSVSLTRVRYDDSTSNLVTHVNKCKPKPQPEQKLMDEFVHGAAYDKAKFRFLISLWIARRHRPYAIVDDPELQQLFVMLYAKVELPSRWTVSRDVREIFAMTKVSVAKLLQSASGSLHIAIDGWTSPNVFSFLGITVLRCEDGKMHSLILDFIKLTKRHTGVYLAEQLAQCLESFGIQKKILSTVADNATNNDSLVVELEGLLPDAPFTAQHRIRCFGHVLNLIVKAILSQFNRSKKGGAASVDHTEDAPEENFDDDEDEDDFSNDGNGGDDDDGSDEEVDEAREASDAAVIEELGAEVDHEVVLTPDEVAMGCFAMTKILGLAKRVFHSPALRDELKDLCVKVAKIEPKILMRAVPTRWNSVAVALQRALYLQLALDKLVMAKQFNTSRGVKLKKYKLSTDEWSILTQLSPILQHFLDATTRISQSTVPLLHEVIPVIDKLTDVLDAAAENTDLFPVVRAAMKRGRKVLDKYYAKTDESILYRCAMLLHPRYKISYFRKHKWLDEWIETAIGVLRTEWEKNYKPHHSVTSSTTTPSARSGGIFNDIDEFGYEEGRDLLDDYLTTPPSNVRDPLAWWNAMAKDGNPLATMALDILSTPATSTDVERAFSRGGLTVSKHRHSLSDESTRAATILSNWAAIPGLIPADAIVEEFRAKFSREKAAVESEPIDISEMTETTE